MNAHAIVIWDAPIGSFRRLRIEQGYLVIFSTLPKVGSSLAARTLTLTSREYPQTPATDRHPHTAGVNFICTAALSVLQKAVCIDE